MEDFKNIITLLNNPDTLELGANLAVSQGLGEKILAFYKLKRSRQNYKKRDLFFRDLILFNFLESFFLLIII